MFFFGTGGDKDIDVLVFIPRPAGGPFFVYDFVVKLFVKHTRNYRQGPNNFLRKMILAFLRRRRKVVFNSLSLLNC